MSPVKRFILNWAASEMIHRMIIPNMFFKCQVAKASFSLLFIEAAIKNPTKVAYASIALFFPGIDSAMIKVLAVFYSHKFRTLFLLTYFLEMQRFLMLKGYRPLLTSIRCSGRRG